MTSTIRTTTSCLSSTKPPIPLFEEKTYATPIEEGAFLWLFPPQTLLLDYIPDTHLLQFFKEFCTLKLEKALPYLDSLQSFMTFLEKKPTQVEIIHALNESVESKGFALLTPDTSLSSKKRLLHIEKTAYTLYSSSPIDERRKILQKAHYPATYGSLISKRIFDSSIKDPSTLLEGDHLNGSEKSVSYKKLFSQRHPFSKILCLWVQDFLEGTGVNYPRLKLEISLFALHVLENTPKNSFLKQTLQMVLKHHSASHELIESQFQNLFRQAQKTKFLEALSSIKSALTFFPKNTFKECQVLVLNPHPANTLLKLPKDLKRLIAFSTSFRQSTTSLSEQAYVPILIELEKALTTSDSLPRALETLTDFLYIETSKNTHPSVLFAEFISSCVHELPHLDSSAWNLEKTSLISSISKLLRLCLHYELPVHAYWLLALQDLLLKSIPELKLTNFSLFHLGFIRYLHQHTPCPSTLKKLLEANRHFKMLPLKTLLESHQNPLEALKAAKPHYVQLFDHLEAFDEPCYLTGTDHPTDRYLKQFADRKLPELVKRLAEDAIASNLLATQSLRLNSSFFKANEPLFTLQEDPFTLKATSSVCVESIIDSPTWLLDSILSKEPFTKELLKTPFSENLTESEIKDIQTILNIPNADAILLHSRNLLGLKPEISFELTRLHHDPTTMTSGMLRFASNHLPLFRKKCFQYLLYHFVSQEPKERLFSLCQKAITIFCEAQDLPSALFFAHLGQGALYEALKTSSSLVLNPSIKERLQLYATLFFLNSSAALTQENAIHYLGILFTPSLQTLFPELTSYELFKKRQAFPFQKFKEDDALRNSALNAFASSVLQRPVSEHWTATSSGFNGSSCTFDYNTRTFITHDQVHAGAGAGAGPIEHTLVLDPLSDSLKEDFQRKLSDSSLDGYELIKKIGDKVFSLVNPSSWHFLPFLGVLKIDIPSLFIDLKQLWVCSNLKEDFEIRLEYTDHPYNTLRFKKQSDNLFLLTITDHENHELLSPETLSLQLKKHLAESIPLSELLIKKDPLMLHASRYGLHFIQREHLCISLEYDGYHLASKIPCPGIGAESPYLHLMKNKKEHLFIFLTPKELLGPLTLPVYYHENESSFKTLLSRLYFIYLLVQRNHYEQAASLLLEFPKAKKLHDNERLLLLKTESILSIKSDLKAHNLLLKIHLLLYQESLVLNEPIPLSDETLTRLTLYFQELISSMNNHSLIFFSAQEELDLAIYLFEEWCHLLEKQYPYLGPLNSSLLPYLASQISPSGLGGSEKLYSALIVLLVFLEKNSTHFVETVNKSSLLADITRWMSFSFNRYFNTHYTAGHKTFPRIDMTACEHLDAAPTGSSQEDLEIFQNKIIQELNTLEKAPNSSALFGRSITFKELIHAYIKADTADIIRKNPLNEKKLQQLFLSLGLYLTSATRLLTPNQTRAYPLLFENRHLLVLEYAEGILLRKEQIVLLEKMLQAAQTPGALVLAKASTGSGKTRCMIPALGLTLKTTGKTTPLLFYIFPPSHQINNFENLKTTLNRCGENTQEFYFDRSHSVKPEALRQILTLFTNQHDKKESLHTTALSIKAFLAHFLMLLAKKEASLEQISLFTSILQLMQKTGIALIDEGHDLHHFEYPIGRFCSLPDNEYDLIEKCFFWLLDNKSPLENLNSADYEKTIASVLIKKWHTELTLTDSLQNFSDFILGSKQALPSGSNETTLYLLKGLLGSLLKNTLSQSIDKNYGFSHLHSHLLSAVPYVASNTTNETKSCFSGLQNPHETLLKTFILYALKGLSLPQLESCITKMKEFEMSGLKVLLPQLKKPLLQLSLSDIKDSVESLSKNPDIIRFYMRHFVKEQIGDFEESLKSSSFLMRALFRLSCSFSATPPEPLSHGPSTVFCEEGTPPPFIEKLQKTNSFHCLSEDIFQNFSFLSKNPANVLLDVGGYFRGQTNDSVAEKIAAYFKVHKMPFEHVRFFCQEKNRFITLSVKHQTKSLHAPSDLNNTFTFFDESRCGASDEPLDSKAIGLVLVSDKTTLGEFRQSIGRLRQLFEGQGVHCALPPSLFRAIQSIDPIKRSHTFYTQLQVKELDRQKHHNVLALKQQLEAHIQNTLLQYLLKAPKEAILPVFETIRSFFVKKGHKSPKELYGGLQNLPTWDFLEAEVKGIQQKAMGKPSLDIFCLEQLDNILNNAKEAHKKGHLQLPTHLLTGSILVGDAQEVMVEQENPISQEKQMSVQAAQDTLKTPWEPNLKITEKGWETPAGAPVSLALQLFKSLFHAPSLQRFIQETCIRFPKITYIGIGIPAVASVYLASKISLLCIPLIIGAALGYAALKLYQKNYPPTVRFHTASSYLKNAPKELSSLLVSSNLYETSASPDFIQKKPAKTACAILDSKLDKGSENKGSYRIILVDDFDAKKIEEKINESAAANEGSKLGERRVALIQLDTQTLRSFTQDTPQAHETDFLIEEATKLSALFMKEIQKPPRTDLEQERKNPPDIIDKLRIKAAEVATKVKDIYFLVAAKWHQPQKAT